MTYRKDSGYESARSEVVSPWSYGPTTIRKGIPYWAAFAFYVANDHPLDGRGADLGILELGHATSSKNAYASPSFCLRRNGTLDGMIFSNPVLDGGPSTRVASKAFSYPVAKGVWHYFIMQFKLEWDAAKKPYFRVWSATGSGSPKKIADSSVANTFNETNTYAPWKFGLYQWDVTDAGWGSSASRTFFTKGFYLFKDEAASPSLDVNSMLEFIRGI
jgi:hypothetical protein